MVRVVRLRHHVGDCELDLHRPCARLLAACDQLQRRCKVLQNGCGLPHDEVTILQKWRSKGRLARTAVVQAATQRGDPLARDRVSPWSPAAARLWPT